MKLARILLFSFAALVILIAATSYFLPATYGVKRQVIVENSADAAFTILNNLKTWEDWGRWTAKTDSAIPFSFSTPDSGKGAFRNWEQENIGMGSIKITESSRPHFLSFDYTVDAGRHLMKGKFELTPLENGCTIQLYLTGKFRDDLFEKYFGLAIDRMLGSKMESNLLQLKMYLESGKVQIR